MAPVSESKSKPALPPAATHSHESSHETADADANAEHHNHQTNHHLKRAWSTRVLEFQFVLPRTPQVQVPLWQTLAFAALAPSLASVITNPFEVAKVRLQLQRSSMHKGIFAQIPETFACLQRTWKLEGIRGLQRGLSLVLWQNSARNVVRLGLYEKVMGILHPESRNIYTTKTEGSSNQKVNNSDSSPPLWKRVVGGAICGAMGAVSGNPFDIIKTRWQAQGKAAEAQTVHQYKGTLHAFQTVLKQEGLNGLYVGVLNNMLLNAIGGAAQLATMYALKDHLLSRQWEDSFGLDLACSIASAAATVIAINPVDVVRTRSYSVGKGKNGRYPFMFSTAKEIFRDEGARAFFRGAGASFMFVVPKYALTFVILGRLHVFAKHREEERAETSSLRKAFKAVDVDCDGVLNQAELRLALKTDLPHTLLYPVSSMSSSRKNSSNERSSSLRNARNQEIRHSDEYRDSHPYRSAASAARRRSDELMERGRRYRDIEVEQEVQRMLLQSDGKVKDAITFEDFAQIGKALRIVLRLKELWKAFDSLDHDRDGRVEVSKIKRALTIAAEEAAEAEADDAQADQGGIMKGASWFTTENEVMRKRKMEAARRIIDKSCTPDAAGTVGFDEFLLIYNKLRDKKLSNVVWLWTKGGPTL